MSEPIHDAADEVCRYEREHPASGGLAHRIGVLFEALAASERPPTYAVSVIRTLEHQLADCQHNLEVALSERPSVDRPQTMDPNEAYRRGVLDGRSAVATWMLESAPVGPPVDPLREAEIGWALGVLEADAVDKSRPADWRYGVRHALSIIRRALASPAVPRPEGLTLERLAEWPLRVATAAPHNVAPWVDWDSGTCVHEQGPTPCSLCCESIERFANAAEALSIIDARPASEPTQPEEERG